MGYERYPRSEGQSPDRQYDADQQRRDYRRDAEGWGGDRPIASNAFSDRDGQRQDEGPGGSRYRRDAGYQALTSRYGSDEPRSGGGDYGRQDPYQPDRGYGQNRGGGQGYGRNRGSSDTRGYGRPPQGYDYEDRGFFDRAGDEVRSWFGDEDANRRRDFDARYDEQRSGTASDDHYSNWRRTQIAALDRDYDEYRREHRSKFDNEFGSWRSQRQGQRDSLSKVEEHMEVLGSDGAHVGTVDKVRGDRIILTKNDADAGGRHHSIPSRWIKTVEDKVTIDKTADEAKRQWRDEERNQAFFNEDGSHKDEGDANGPHILGKSFSGTY